MEDGEYTAKDITVLSGPQGIRKRPAMYIGSTGSPGFIHLLYEVIDNAVDESMGGYCKNIKITLTREDNCDVAEVADDGRGIPVDIMEKEGRPALEVIMTSIHAGAKFSNKVYKVSGGLHGVGLTVVNSLSEYTIVTVKKGGKVYRETFSRGAPTSSLEITGSVPSGDTGTSIKFKPDTSIFSVDSFDSIELDERLRDISYLNPGLSIVFIDERGEERKETQYKSEKGVSEFLEYLKGSAEEVSKPINVSKTVDTVSVQIIFQYVKNYSENVVSFVNNIRTREGGVHVTGFHTAITRAITNYLSKKNGNGGSSRKPQVPITGEDTREGLIAIISILMQNPEFEGQTKEKLGSISIKSVVDTVLYNGFSTFLEENPADASSIIEKVTSAAEARESARRARDLARKKSVFEGTLLPGKLADCTVSDPEKTELFIVEGRSAAGSSKEGRDRLYQAILPLRGKVLNVEKAGMEKIFNNAELHALVTALGTGIESTFNPDKIRYNKIILLTDADVDGSHIKTLLLTFIYRYMRPLIEKGHVYVAQPPLYGITHGKEVMYAYTDADLEVAMRKYDRKAAVQRYKGLGEMNPEQLWDTTMDQKTRVLKRITITDAQKADALFSVLMGINVSERRKFIEEHATEVSFLDV